MNEGTRKPILKVELRRVAIASTIALLVIAAATAVLVAAEGRSIAEREAAASTASDGIADSVASDGHDTPDARGVSGAPGATPGMASLARLPSAGARVMAGQSGDTPVLLSVNSSGSDSGSSTSSDPVVSADGQYVAFHSSASDLVGTDSNSARDVFRRDTVAGTTVLVSVNSAGTDSGDGSSEEATISRDGRYVAFRSYAADLVDTDTNTALDVFVRDVAAGTTALVSVNASGTDSGDGSSSGARISANGRYVAFRSSVNDLVAGDTNGEDDVFVRDRVDGTTELVSVNAAGTDSGNSSSSVRGISTSGRYVVFTSHATDLVVISDTNGLTDVFVRDMVAGTTTLVSVNEAGNDSGNNESADPVISADGRYVAFQSYASDLVAILDTNSTRDVFVRDLVAGTTALVSVTAAGTVAGNDGSSWAAISSDGRYVAFESYASDLVVTDTNGNEDVFVRDLLAGTTTLVSVNSAGTDTGSSQSFDSGISADGQRVVFQSYATDLVVTDTNGKRDVFLRDLVAETTIRASTNVTGTDGGNGISEYPVISAYGGYVAFESHASDLVATDTNSSKDVFGLDLRGTVVIVKEATPADGTNFRFNSDIPGALLFHLDDLEPINNDDLISKTRTLENVAYGVYTVSEQLPSADWVLWDIECVDPSADSSGDTGSHTASIDLSAFETVTCTFRNAVSNTISLQGSTLLVVGSGAREQIDVERISIGPVWIEARIEDLDTHTVVSDTFHRVFDRVVIYGLSGDDEMRMYANVGSTDAELYGGAGDDNLIGGRANDVLVGGVGDDRLSGGLGRDILIGGGGVDDVFGGDGHDLLVGGEYAGEENRAANQAILDEWSRLDLGHEERVDNLETGGGLNGEYVLNDSTVSDPTPEIGELGDDLSGEVGREWFLASAGDKLDRVANEALTGISQ